MSRWCPVLPTDILVVPFKKSYPINFLWKQPFQQFYRLYTIYRRFFRKCNENSSPPRKKLFSERLSDYHDEIARNKDLSLTDIKDVLVFPLSKPIENGWERRQRKDRKYSYHKGKIDLLRESDVQKFIIQSENPLNLGEVYLFRRLSFPYLSLWWFFIGHHPLKTKRWEISGNGFFISNVVTLQEETFGHICFDTRHHLVE